LIDSESAPSAASPTKSSASVVDRSKQSAITTAVIFFHDVTPNEAQITGGKELSEAVEYHRPQIKELVRAGHGRHRLFPAQLARVPKSWVG
jgi:hypothetical protein